MWGRVAFLQTLLDTEHFNTFFLEFVGSAGPDAGFPFGRPTESQDSKQKQGALQVRPLGPIEPVWLVRPWRTLGLGDECTVIVHGDGKSLEEEPAPYGASLEAASAGTGSEILKTQDDPSTTGCIES